MSVILAIETSADLASAALMRGEEMLVRESMGVQTHSQTILPVVQQLLAEAELSLKQCDAVAFGCGPGSFTGVRTACGIVQGLAFGAGLPVVPVVTLLAMAEACRAEHDAAEVLSVLDARMGEVYWAQYRFDGRWHEIMPPALSGAESVAPQGKVVACGNGLTAYAEAFAGRGFTPHALTQIVPHARDVARLAQVMFASGAAINARDAQPLYLRNKVALTTAERMQKAEAA
ncbi:MAG TPA: tRNA (adenosine(37)-N6)-threonylcarbamoyltransferase complex dimerization subunit type 1 TsaB [Burkholderiaceae bacterium]